MTYEQIVVHLVWSHLFGVAILVALLLGILWSIIAQRSNNKHFLNRVRAMILTIIIVMIINFLIGLSFTPSPPKTTKPASEPPRPALYIAERGFLISTLD